MFKPKQNPKKPGCYKIVPFIPTPQDPEYCDRRDVWLVIPYMEYLFLFITGKRVGTTNSWKEATNG